MLKFIFWSLLAVNAALFAYGRGYLGHFSGNEREPERLLNQLNADKLAIISAEKANNAAAAATAAPETKPEVQACLEVASFVLADARRFESQLEALKLGDRQSRHNLPGSEVSSYIVYIPPQGSKEGADKKAGELRALGVSNYFIMSDNSPLRWGISLGVFKTEGAAQNQLAALMKQGVRTARVAPRMSGSKLLAYQFRDVDADLKAKLEKIRAGFPNTETRSCK
ncbi:SPOR domain-containing protein [Pseudoduganella sp. FT55W]|uniref:SPOR domain-containing protein n=1 Tax=Duganella rivi TaxID=2666083 RepID=A0A7X4GNC1_9BURK|nr:SPOR domain-containing protein [Duganella rivi]